MYMHWTNARKNNAQTKLNLKNAKQRTFQVLPLGGRSIVPHAHKILEFEEIVGSEIMHNL